MSIFLYPENGHYNTAINNGSNFKYIKYIENIIKPKSFKEVFHTIRDLFRNIFLIIKIFATKNNKNIYVAFVCDGGMGDMIRYKAVIEELTKMYKNIVIDVYNKKTKKIYNNIKQIRFYLNMSSICFTKNRYDVIYNCCMVVFPIQIKENHNTTKILKNIVEYKKSFPFCFKDNIVECKKNGINIITLSKTLSGVDNVFNVKFSIIAKNCSLLKFGIDEDMKFITFQCGAGETGLINNAKCWDIDNWNKMFSIVKKHINKEIKIVQLGTGDCYVKQADICLLKKTSLDELFYIISKSSLHIDIDGACSHIAKAVGTKALIMFGPTDGIYSAYNENINIISSVCGSCWKNKCPKKQEQNICMKAIEPQFVANKVIEYINSINIASI